MCIFYCKRVERVLVPDTQCPRKPCTQTSTQAEKLRLGSKSLFRRFFFRALFLWQNLWGKKMKKSTRSSFPLSLLCSILSINISVYQSMEYVCVCTNIRMYLICNVCVHHACYHYYDDFYTLMTGALSEIFHQAIWGSRRNRLYNIHAYIYTYICTK